MNTSNKREWVNEKVRAQRAAEAYRNVLLEAQEIIPKGIEAISCSNSMQDLINTVYHLNNLSYAVNMVLENHAE